MAWPKKHTKRLHYQGIEFLWQCPDPQYNYQATIGVDGSKYFLTVDLDFTGVWPLVRPSDVKRALAWALANGWSFEKGPNKMMAGDKDVGFHWTKQNANKSVVTTPDAARPTS